MSNWIRDRLISGDALIGEGRAARINVKIAQAQLAQRRDVGQACGNGLKTRLRPRAETPAADAAPPDATTPGRIEVQTDSYLRGVVVMAREMAVTAVCDAFTAGVERAEAEILYRRVRESARGLARHLFTMEGRGSSFAEVWDEARVEPMDWDALVADRDEIEAEARPLSLD